MTNRKLVVNKLIDMARSESFASKLKKIFEENHMKQVSVNQDWAAVKPKSEEKHQFLKRISDDESDNNGLE
jgi:hypothetical protein